MTRIDRRISKRDRRIYDLAWDYLIAMDKRITPKMVERYMHPREYRNLHQLNRKLLDSVRNTGRAQNVITPADLDRLAVLLRGFSPRFIVAQYGAPDGSRKLIAEVERLLAPKKLETASRSLWPKFCRSVVSSSRFLAQFKSAADFYEWAREFESLDERSKAALPLLIAEKVKGLGFPTACNFLKEVGLTQFGKPDVYLKRMFTDLDLCNGDSDLEVFEAILRVARNVAVTPYRVDKVFWLIGSGKLYYHKAIKMASHEKPFIAWVQSKESPGLRIGKR